MRNLLLTTVAALALTGPAFAWDKAAMNKQVDATVFAFDGICSATLVDADNGLLLTANHCVHDLYDDVLRETVDDQGVVHKHKYRVAVPATVRKQEYVGPNMMKNTTYKVTVKAADPLHDLAIVQSKMPVVGTSAPIACQEVERGDTVYAVGNPFVKLYASVSKGIVSSVQRDYDELGLGTQDEFNNAPGENGLVQSTALISGGSSGGALYNDNGELVGVTVRGGGGWSFSVPQKDVVNFLNSNGMNICGGAHDAGLQQRGYVGGLTPSSQKTGSEEQSSEESGESR